MSGLRAACFGDIEAHPILDRYILTFNQRAVLAVWIRICHGINGVGIRGIIRKREFYDLLIRQFVVRNFTRTAIYDDIECLFVAGGIIGLIVRHNSLLLSDY